MAPRRVFEGALAGAVERKPRQTPHGTERSGIAPVAAHTGLQQAVAIHRQPQNPSHSPGSCPPRRLVHFLRASQRQ